MQVGMDNKYNCALTEMLCSKLINLLGYLLHPNSYKTDH